MRSPLDYLRGLLGESAEVRQLRKDRDWMARLDKEYRAHSERRQESDREAYEALKAKVESLKADPGPQHVRDFLFSRKSDDGLPSGVAMALRDIQGWCLDIREAEGRAAIWGVLATAAFPHSVRIWTGRSVDGSTLQYAQMIVPDAAVDEARDEATQILDRVGRRFGAELAVVVYGTGDPYKPLKPCGHGPVLVYDPADREVAA